MTDTITERLKAVRNLNNKLLGGEYTEISERIEAHIEAIQQTISSAESDAGKLLEVLGFESDEMLPAIELITTALLKAGEQGWMDISTAPKDGTEILGYGLCAGEIGHISKQPHLAVISWSNGKTDISGFEWDIPASCGYAAWMKPTYWQPIIPPSSQGGE